MRQKFSAPVWQFGKIRNQKTNHSDPSPIAQFSAAQSNFDYRNITAPPAIVSINRSFFYDR
jgi:hypothetical protein